MDKKLSSRCSAKLKVAIREIDKEIGSNGQTVGKFCSLDQLKKIHFNLQQMLNSLDDGSISWSYLGFGRMIVDSWPMNSELGAILLEAEQEYKKLLK